MIPPIANRFVAGTTPATALDYTRELNARNVTSILNVLGEHYDERAPADEDTRAYVDLVDEIGTSDVEACISIKPSQIGIGVSPSVFEANLETIVDRAARRDVFVWLDMEDATTTDATLGTFEKHVTSYPNMGVCLQANLKRTGADLRRLADVPGKVRLVKGAYNEPPEIAHQERSRVDATYREHLAYLFEEWGEGIAVGSHDPAMIATAIELHEQHGSEFELQMLMGVRESAQFDYATDYPVYQYVPFGDKWLSYFYRRLRERKGNVLFALRAIVSG